MKVGLVEYKNVVSASGTPLGHGIKVLVEAYQICKMLDYEVKVIAADSYRSKELLQCTYVVEPYDFVEGSFSPYKLYPVFKNIKKALKETCKDDVVWFTNVDWRLFAYLGLHRIRRNIVITEYKDSKKDIQRLARKKGIIGSIVRMICNRGHEKIALCIQTYNANLDTKECLYMPDYIYLPEQYKEKQHKEERAICIGTINNVQKDILGLVNVFTKFDFPLLLAGVFVDESLFEEVQRIKTKNISIMNRQLSETEYKELLATSKYAIVPYKMTVYQDATSGVVREALYLGVKVIAPSKLLQNMQIEGKGYENIEDIPELIKDDNNLPNSIDLKKCSFDYIAKKLGKRFTEICAEYK